MYITFISYYLIKNSSSTFEHCHFETKTKSSTHLYIFFFFFFLS